MFKKAGLMGLFITREGCFRFEKTRYRTKSGLYVRTNVEFAAAGAYHRRGPSGLPLEEKDISLALVVPQSVEPILDLGK